MGGCSQQVSHSPQDREVQRVGLTRVAMGSERQQIRSDRDQRGRRRDDEDQRGEEEALRLGGGSAAL